MREILFRAKKEDDGEWIEGYYAKTLMNDGIPLCLTDCRIYDLIIAEGNYYYISPKTLGQYTGLKDKNGTKIFEGDRVRWKTFGDYYEPWYFVTGVAYWDEKDFEYMVRIDGRPYSNKLSYILKEKLEIIGNIHDKEK